MVCGEGRESLRGLGTTALSLKPEGEGLFNRDGVTTVTLESGTVTVLISREDATDIFVGVVCGLGWLGEECGVATILVPREEDPGQVVRGDAMGFNFRAGVGDSMRLEDREPCGDVKPKVPEPVETLKLSLFI